MGFFFFFYNCLRSVYKSPIPVLQAEQWALEAQSQAMNGFQNQFWRGVHKFATTSKRISPEHLQYSILRNPTPLGVLGPQSQFDIYPLHLWDASGTFDPYTYPQMYPEENLALLNPQFLTIMAIPAYTVTCDAPQFQVSSHFGFNSIFKTYF